MLSATLLHTTLFGCALLAAACSNSSDSTVNDIDSGAEQNTLDASSSDIQVGSIVATKLDAEVLCNESSCDVRVTELAAPTRFDAKGRADGGEVLVFDGFDNDTLYWASATGLTILETGPYVDFSRPVDGRVWVVSETRIRQIDQEGRVWQEISELPNPLLTDTFIDQVGDAMLWGGFPTQLWMWQDGSWTELSLGDNVGVTNIVALSDDHALFLGNGYFYLWNIHDHSLERFAGTDDAYDSAVRCSPTEYWAGGWTGMKLHCDVNTTCSFGVESTFYDFEAHSIGCVDSGLVSFLYGDFRRTEPDGSASSSPAPDMRHLWADLGILWTISNPEE